MVDSNEDAYSYFCWEKGYPLRFTLTGKRMPIVFLFLSTDVERQWLKAQMQ